MESKSTLVTVVTIIGAVVAPLAALAVAYGLLTQDESELWVALIVALLGALGAMAPVLIGRNYNDNRAAVVIESMKSNTPGAVESF